MVIDSKSDVSTVDLIKEAVGEARALLKVETNLAREELRRDISALKISASALFLAVQLGVIGVTLLIMAALLEFSLNPVPAAAWVGVSMLIAGAGLGAIAYFRRPKPLRDLKQHLGADLKIIREGVA